MIFNRLKLGSPYRAMAISIGLLFGLGLLLYVIARYLPEPQWALNAIERLSPHIGGLVNAKRVANHLGNSPFPTQVIILYGAFGSFIWMAWFSYLIWRDRGALTADSFNNYLAMPLSKRPSRLHIFIAAVFLFSLPFLLWLRFFFYAHTMYQVTWRDALFYSDSVSSYLFLISILFCISVAVPASAIMFNLYHLSKGILK